MKRLRQQSIERLKRAKKWQWLLLSFAVLSSLVAIDIGTTKFSAGFWGILDDEIAVVTIESDEEGKQNVTITDPSKSVWDGLEVLGVPIVLVLLGAWLQGRQQEQSEKIAERQREQSDKIAEERREQDGNEAREEALQTYIDRISALLIDKSLMTIAAKKEAFDAIKQVGIIGKTVRSYDFGEIPTALIPSTIDQYFDKGNHRNLNIFLGLSKEDRELLDVAIDVIQARTLSILRRFEKDSERKSSVIRFLVEAGVIARLGIKLSSTSLSGANLSGANLSGANLNSAKLNRANLFNANLNNANLNNAKLNSAELFDANLNDAKLFGAHLNDAKLNSAKLNNAKLFGAKLNNAKLNNAKLNNADLRDADLSGAKLRNAKLNSAKLNNADLRDADLSGAIVTNTQFGEGIGLSDEEKQDLINRGAIFDAELEEQQPTP